jgi:hypothetical protein
MEPCILINLDLRLIDRHVIIYVCKVKSYVQNANLRAPWEIADFAEDLDLQ